MHEMLSEWLRQTNPPSTWTALADATEEVDPSKAMEIRDQFVDINTDEEWI